MSPIPMNFGAGAERSFLALRLLALSYNELLES